MRDLVAEAKRGIASLNPGEEVVKKLRAVVSTPGLSALIALIEVMELLSKTPDRQPILGPNYQHQAALADTTTRIRAAIDFVDGQYQRPISLPEIATICHFSPNAFCRWFKQQMGLTFVDYVNKVRLTHVCQLLISTDLAIGHIGSRTGFENISTLNSLFQQKLGTSLGKYREQHDA